MFCATVFSKISGSCGIRVEIVPRPASSGSGWPSTAMETRSAS